MNPEGSRNAPTTRGIDRRAFLTGRLRSAARPPRPPGADDERMFLARCTRCEACLAACPTRVIARGAGGYPEMVFDRAECTFCGRCTDACLPGALAPPAVSSLTAVVSSACLALGAVLCRACAEACPAGALTFRPAARIAPRIDRSTCTGCGACVRTCPAAAIAMMHGEAAA